MAPHNTVTMHFKHDNHASDPEFWLAMHVACVRGLEYVTTSTL